MAPPTSQCSVLRQAVEHCTVACYCEMCMFPWQEWGTCGPVHRFLGSYRLEHDRSWTQADLIERRSKDIAAIDRVIQSQNAVDCIDHGTRTQR